MHTFLLPRRQIVETLEKRNPWYEVRWFARHAIAMSSRGLNSINQYHDASHRMGSRVLAVVVVTHRLQSYIFVKEASLYSLCTDQIGSSFQPDGWDGFRLQCAERVVTEVD